MRSIRRINEEIKLLWEEFMNEYQEYFLTNEEIWINKLKEVKKYIDENDKRPSSIDKNENIKTLGGWLLCQKNNYPNKKSMKNKKIKLLWEEFINEYKKYFLTDEEKWKNKLEEVKKYIDENKKRPSSEDKNENTKVLGKWIGTQKSNYPDKKSMKNLEIKQLWETFINEYQEYFLTDEEIWKNKLEEVKKYIDKNKKLPSNSNENTKSLGNWLSMQKQKYKNNKEIMKNLEIKLLWEEFINKYQEYF